MARPKLSHFGICKISVASLRQLPSHKSFLVSQVLFGEYVSIISKKKDWYRVECSWDGIVGWMDPKQLYVLKEADLKSKTECSTFSLEHLHGLNSNTITIPISLGSNLYHCDGLNVKMPFGNFQFQGQIVSLQQARNSARLLASIARRYIHCPHLFGGRSILGVDAAGFIQVIFKMIGISMPRNCSEQSKMGTDIGFQSQARFGDLAFFESEAGLIEHVGLVQEDNTILHVYGQVRLDLIDQHGIFDKAKKKYTHKLRTIRRIAELIE